MPNVDFSSAAHELYGVTPGEFTQTRKRLVQEARAGGDAALAKRIGALRRPTLPAWAVNLLSRSTGEELGWLLDVGAQLRAAWSSGGSIGELEQRRSELVALLVRRARELAEEAGQPLREPAVREVEDTLQAATVDGDVAEEVDQGRLTQPRSHTGFVPAGFPVSIDRPPPPQPAQRPEPQVDDRAQQRTDRPPPPEPPKRMDDRARRRMDRPPEASAPESAKRVDDRARLAARQRTDGPSLPESAERPEPRVEDRARRAARRRAERAERELAEREAEYAEARDDVRTADAEAGRLRRELDKIRRELDRAVAGQETAARRLEKAERRRDRAAEEARRKANDAM